MTEYLELAAPRRAQPRGTPTPVEVGRSAGSERSDGRPPPAGLTGVVEWEIVRLREEGHILADIQRWAAQTYGVGMDFEDIRLVLRKYNKD